MPFLARSPTKTPERQLKGGSSFGSWHPRCLWFTTQTLFRSLLRSESGGASGRSRRCSFPQEPPRTAARGNRGHLMSPAWFFHFTTPPLVVVGIWVWSAGGLVKDALEGSQPSASWSFLQKTLITGRRTSGVVGHYGMCYRWRNNLISFELVSGNLLLHREALHRFV